MYIYVSHKQLPEAFALIFFKVPVCECLSTHSMKMFKSICSPLLISICGDTCTHCIWVNF